MALYDIPLDLAVEAIGWVTDKVGMGGATAMCNVTVTKMDELLDAVLARINARTRGARVHVVCVRVHWLRKGQLRSPFVRVTPFLLDPANSFFAETPTQQM